MSKSQLFKLKIPIIKLKEYLDSTCQIEDDMYTFDYNAFKKGDYNL